MPIYAYRCSACGYQNDYLLKISDPLLSECPQCGKSTFQKQVTAAGFQLKGTGWYATDFKNNGKSKSSTGKEPTSTPEEPKKESSKGGGEGGGSSGDSGSKPDGAASSTSATPASS